MKKFEAINLVHAAAVLHHSGDISPLEQAADDYFNHVCDIVNQPDGDGDAQRVILADFDAFMFKLAQARFQYVNF